MIRSSTSFSPANRVETLAERLNETLTGAPNGWLLEYYPSSGQYYGGFNVFLSFSEGNKVKVGSEVAGKGKTATSTYSIYQSAGCVLTLDTYNEVMHYFADPETTGGQGAGFGFEGDFEFNVLDLQDEKITLKGRKTGSTMTMTPMPVSMSWDDYIVALKEEESAISKHTRIRYPDSGQQIRRPHQRQDCWKSSAKLTANRSRHPTHSYSI